MLKKLRIAVLLPIVLCLFSCGSDAPKQEEKKRRIFPEYTEELDDIVRSQDGMIRGIDLNARPEAVSKAENATPSEKDSSYVYYEYKINANTDYSIAYTFVNDSLEEIDLQVNCKDVDQSTRFLAI